MMGMFDYIEVHGSIDLPELPVCIDRRDFQTKFADQPHLNCYRVNSAKRLQLLDSDTGQWRDVAYHGHIYIIGSCHEERRYTVFVEYGLKFTDDVLVGVDLLDISYK